MTAPTATATATAVHVQMDSFAALYEGAVAWDACGPVAAEVAMAALEGRKPDIGLAQKIRADAIAAGKFTPHSGQTLANIVWELEQRGYTALTVVPFSNTPDPAALHALIKLGGLNKWPVIIEVSRAYNLPDNEGGVDYHFVVLGGIDSARGYLVANGDTKTGIANAKYHSWPGAFDLPLNWATWQTLQAAGISGAILVHPKGWTPPAPPPPPAPTTVTVELSAIMALRAQATDALTALTTLATNVDALPTK